MYTSKMTQIERAGGDEESIFYVSCTVNVKIVMMDSWSICGVILLFYIIHIYIYIYDDDEFMLNVLRCHLTY